MGQVVAAAVYHQGRKVFDIELREGSQWAAQADHFVWIGLQQPDAAQLRSLQQQFGLHELAVEDARHGHQRPKIEEYGDQLFAVLHTVEFTPSGELSTGEVNIFVGLNFVLSVRNRSQYSFLGVRARAERESQLLRYGAGFVFYALMDAVVDRYFPIIDQLESELEAIEGRIFDHGKGRSNIEQLYALKQRAMVLRHAVAPLAEAVGKLIMGRVPAICADTREYFRDVYDHLLRINAALDTLRETIVTAIQVNFSMVTIEESEVTKKLAAWAGIFAVATFFVGVWGMNFEHMPELKWTWGYPLALSTIVGACSLVAWRFRRAGWL